MAKWGELSDFTYSELSALKWEDLTFKVDALLLMITDRNIELPVKTYEKFLSLCDKVIIDKKMLPRPKNTVFEVLNALSTIISLLQYAYHLYPYIVEVINEISATLSALS